MQKRLIRIFIVILLFLSGCSKSPEQVSISQSQSVGKGSLSLTHSIGEVLDPGAKKIIDSWQEYDKVEQLISEFYNISTDQALQKSTELAKATQQLRDSVRVDRFLQPDLQMRLNVMNNIALRLSDMNTIAQIDAKEISDEVGNLMQLFSSINRRLNNIVRQEALEKELKPFNNLK